MSPGWTTAARPMAASTAFQSIACDDAAVTATSPRAESRAGASRALVVSHASVPMTAHAMPARAMRWECDMAGLEVRVGEVRVGIVSRHQSRDSIKVLPSRVDTRPRREVFGVDYWVGGRLRMDDVLREFLTESTENLIRLEQGIVELERAPGDTAL